MNSVSGKSQPSKDDPLVLFRSMVGIAASNKQSVAQRE
jgi:hypothetical protein